MMNGDEIAEFRQHQDWMIGFASYLCGDQDFAEKLVLDALAFMAFGAGWASNTESLKLRVCRAIVRMYRQHRPVKPLPAGDTAGHPVFELGSTARGMLFLKQVARFRYQEIASVFETTVARVISETSRGRALLCDHLPAVESDASPRDEAVIV